MSWQQAERAALYLLVSLIVAVIVVPLFSPLAAAPLPVRGAQLHEVWLWWMWASRQSLLIVSTTSAVALFVGLPIGLLSGSGGEFNEVGVTRALEFVGRLPSILLVGVLRFWDPTQGILAVVCTLALLRSLEVARVVRLQVATRVTTGFVVSAEGLGAGLWWRLRHHLLPDLRRPILATLAAGASASLGVEAALSFVGLGLPRHWTAWGGGLGTPLHLQSSPTFWLAAMSLVGACFAFRRIASYCMASATS